MRIIGLIFGVTVLMVAAACHVSREFMLLLMIIFAAGMTGGGYC